MKRLITLILCAALALSLCACGRASSAETAPVAEVAADDPVIKAFRAVLAGADPFTSAFSGATLRVANDTIPNETGFPTLVRKLALLDLDSDGVRELILQMDAVDTRDTFGYWILRYQEDKVLGYDLNYTTFDQPKMDGTFSRDEGGLSGIGSMRFTEAGWEMDYEVMSKKTLDANYSVISQEYFIDGQSATAQEASDIYDKQMAKPDVKWYFFSMKNFERAVLSSSSNLEEILSGKGLFYSQGDQMLLTAENYCRIHTAFDGESISIPRAAVLDMDGDGVMEAVLELTSGGANCGMVVLHEQKGQIVGVAFDSQAVTSLKTDGTFGLAGGTFTRNIVSKIEFGPAYWSDVRLLREENTGSGSAYFIGATTATEAEFEKALAEQNAKEDAQWAAFPCENPAELLE